LEISSDAASTQLRIDNDDRICNRVENLRQTLKSWALVNVRQNLSCELIVVDNRFQWSQMRSDCAPRSALKGDRLLYCLNSYKNSS
jgi:hypothetical protein